MKTRVLMPLLALAVLCGCESYPQTLKFKDFQSLCGTAKISIDMRYHFGEGWSTPKLPGTNQSFEKENCVDFRRAGMVMQIFGEAHYREAEDGDTVRPGEWAAVNEAYFSPGPVDGEFRISRERVGFRFGFFAPQLIFGAGFGLFYHGIQIDGDVRNATVRGAVHNDNNGFGYMLWLEISPGWPPLRLYLNWGKWDAYGGKGYWRGEETEIGLKYRFRGFEVFAGYRIDEFSGRNDHNLIGQSRLKFYLRGPVLGMGVAF